MSPMLRREIPIVEDPILFGLCFGNTLKIVGVKTKAGYYADPGDAGTGSIIAIQP